MKLSLLGRILITLAIITTASLLLVWLVIRPQYEKSILADRFIVLQQLQKSSIHSLDYTIAGWSNVSRFIASQVTERPNEGETILRTVMALHPDIIQMRIHSTGLSDELISQNISYPAWNLEIKDSVWVPSKGDSTLHIAWLNRKDSMIQVFALQTKFQVQHIPFVLTVTWDAKRLYTILSELPFDSNYSVSIRTSSGIIAQNASSFKLDKTFRTVDKFNSIESIQEGTNSWHILTSAFQSARLWMSVAVPEEALLKPVEEFLLYSTSLIIGLMFLMSILGWWVSHQMKKFIEKMKTFYSASGI